MGERIEGKKENGREGGVEKKQRIKRRGKQWKGGRVAHSAFMKDHVSVMLMLK